jgi:hypothetical protein
MATCARCGGYLGDHHTCHGRLAAAATWSLDLVLACALGSALGLLVLGEAALRLTGQSFEVVGLAVGPFLAFALLRALRRVSHPGSPRF